MIKFNLFLNLIDAQIVINVIDNTFDNSYNNKFIDQNNRNNYQDNDNIVNLYLLKLRKYH